MNIGIIGAGSIGLLFSAYLSKIANVVLYTRTMEQADVINQNGLILQKGSHELNLSVSAKPFKDWQGNEDLSIIAVKQYQLNNVMEQIVDFSSSLNSLLFLQNGMGHLEGLMKILAKNIYVGSVEHGALKMGANLVSHNGEGVTNVAVYKGSTNCIHKLSSLVSTDFPINLKEDYYKMLINKLVINAVINPLTAILRVKNGELLENPYYYQTAKKLFSEITYLLDLESPNEHFEQITTICRKTADNRSSMLKDIEANRTTEVEAILGFLLKVANTKDRDCPIVECLYHLIRGKELSGGQFQ